MYIIKDLPLSVLNGYGYTDIVLKNVKTSNGNYKERHILSLFLETSAIPTTDDLRREIQRAY